MTEFLGVHWASPDRLLLLPLVGILVFLLIKHVRYRLRVATQLSHPRHEGLFLKNFSIVKEQYKLALGIVGLGLLFFALLLPQWGKHEEQVVQQGRDLLVVLDISRSMLAQDLRPNRLTFAKLKIRTLLSKLKAERVGLILFSGSAFVHCPLTADYNAFLLFLEQVEVEQFSLGTTAIDNALLEAIQVFGKSKDRKNKLVFLMTDGEDFSTDLSHVKKLAAEQNISLFTMGVGSIEGAPVPKFDRAGNQIGHEIDSTGKTAMTKLNEPLLQEIAKNLQGNYIKTRQDDRDLDEFVSLVQKYEKEQFSEQKVSLYEHQYHWFLLGAFICFIIEWVL
ncbi:VWA domain-containing protein [Candidatus Dependentiae bacterium]|nr:VWA domain-containing protein [Candidatus Dependentiae bacterium]